MTDALFEMAAAERTRAEVSARTAYRALRNYLAGQVLGSTRDESLLHEALKAVLCKSYLQVSPEGTATASAGQRYRAIWAKVSADLPALFSPDDDLRLSDENLAEVDRILESVDLHDPGHDPFGDLYEVFMGDVSKGQAGQFFTPQNAVQLLIDLVDPQPGERVMDPASGAGGFLAGVARRHMSAGADPRDVAKWLVGTDKDEYLARLCLARLAVLTSARSDVYCADSLAWVGDAELPTREELGGVDVILTNPPFGAKIVAASKAVQQTFALGHQWRRDRKSGEWAQTPTLQRTPAPQVLFVERCLDLLRPGGRLGMVVPESLISSRTHGYVVAYLERHAEVQAVIGMPESLFKVTGSGGTHTKTCLVLAKKRGEASPASTAGSRVFMAEAKWCGNDSRGRRIFPDELPQIAERWMERSDQAAPRDHLGYEVAASEIVDGVYAPRYYNPDIAAELYSLSETHELVKVQSLLDEGVLEIRTGDEVGKQAYGTGDIPFVRTSDISNWELKLDPKHGVAEEIYESLKHKQDVSEGDILMVRDGTYLVGTCAYVTKYDTRIVYQSHLMKIRVRRPDVISPFLILAALTSGPAKRQIVSKRFTQDIIDSLGDRLREVVLPLPLDVKVRAGVTAKVEKAICDRMEARELARQACVDIVGSAAAYDDEESAIL
jgi:type I restriction enzyme M protein